ncbi:hypothetical protein ACQ4M3_09255 [Leptolyngbya sp. AN03gr2]|uniref:hypothetical protein n=1 Tax=Leptolyngbya sp. AN03gr2 TaxID=3423364 RepID=UPI003D31AF82
MDVKQNQAIANASAAIGLIEQLGVILEDLNSYKNTLPSIHQVELVGIATRLTSLIKVLDEDENLPSLVQSMQLSGRVSSKVERLRLGGEIIRLRELGRMSIDEIATQIALAPQTVSRFLKYYDSIKDPSEKSRFQRASIFDTTNQLEDLSAMIYRQLAKLESVDPEHHVRYIGELRMTIKAAQEWMDRVSNAQKMDELKSVVAEILMRYVSETDRPMAIRDIQQAGMRTASPSTMALNP